MAHMLGSYPGNQSPENLHENICVFVFTYLYTTAALPAIKRYYVATVFLVEFPTHTHPQLYDMN